MTHLTKLPKGVIFIPFPMEVQPSVWPDHYTFNYLGGIGMLYKVDTSYPNNGYPIDTDTLNEIITS